MPKELNFPAPEGFTPPEGTGSGEQFQVMATVALGDDGMLSLTEIDGAPISLPYPEDDMEAAEEGGEVAAEEAPAGEGFLMAIEDGVSKGG